MSGSENIIKPEKKLSNSILNMPPRKIPLNTLKNNFLELYGYRPHGNNKKFKELVNNNRLQNDNIYNKIKKLNEVKLKERQIIKVQKRIRKNIRNKYINKLKNEIINNKDKLVINRNEYTKFIEPEVFAYIIINTISYLALIKVGDINYALNETNKINLLQSLKDGLIEVVDEGGSDNQLLYNLINTNTIIIERIILTNKYKTNEGAFFPYYVKDDKNLKLNEYQIYRKYELLKSNNENCLLYALNMGGFPIEKLERIKPLIRRKHIPATELNKVCKLLNISIHLRKLRRTQTKNDKSLLTKYGDNKDQIFNIGLIENHYFIINKSCYTKYSILNYEKVKHIKDFNYLIDDKGTKDKNKCLNSFDLIALLVDNKDDFLYKIDMGLINKLDEEYMLKRNENNFLDLTYEDCDYKECEKIELKIKEENIIFFDFETFNDENNKIEPYLLCSENQEGIKKSFIGNDCGLQLLKSLDCDNITLIAHNAKFDSRFLIHHLKQCSEIENNGNYISFKGKFYNRKCKKNIKITIKDSYKLIPEPLKKFSKLFKLDVEKEYMDYKLYNKDNLLKRYIPYDECIKNANDDEKKLFNKNIYKWDCLKNRFKIDIIEYSRRYCEMDVSVLKKGYNIFRENCLNHFNIDINGVLTIPSLANIYITNKGCYDGCYELAGQPRNFIEKCIVGGRTMLSNNEKSKIYNKIMMDFDAVSLYPSAMYRMEGFLKGLPKIIKNLNYDDIKNYSGYFVEIKINKLNINRSFPLASIVDDNNVRQFTNNLEGKNIFVDKYTLEDLIEHQKIDFQIIKGYYFNDGFNKKINEVIKYIFDKRKEYKKLGDPCEIIYKLIMNSGYGKSIQKPHETKTKIFDNHKTYNAYISKNYNKVMNTIEYGKGKFKVNVSTKINTHFNKCHIGCNILSMSKRIMNEVMTLAEDNNINIYYQDTDSMHLLDKDIKNLQQLFNDKYKKELIGNDMGQFHTDFNMKDCKNVYARNSIFLGKKSYIDELCGTDEEGNDHIDYHIRMKGISNDAIKYYCDKEKINPLQLYEKLFNGDSVEFDLTCNGNKFIAKYDKNYSINNVTDFKRKVQFG